MLILILYDLMDKIISRDEFVKGTESKDFDANEEYKKFDMNHKPVLE